MSARDLFIRDVASGEANFALDMDLQALSNEPDCEIIMPKYKHFDVVWPKIECLSVSAFVSPFLENTYLCLVHVDVKTVYFAILIDCM